MQEVTHARPFRFGVSASRAASRVEWIAKARKAEDLGYDTLLVADHLTELLPPFLPLLTAAEATTRLRVGTLVLNNDFRHPVLVTREAATVDLLSEGRFELGLGAGHMKSEYDETGIRFDPGPQRIERLTEAVAIIKGLWSGDAVTFAGRHYLVSGHTLYPATVQRPHPPLLIGGNNPGVLRLAAREADIIGLTGFGEKADGTKVLDGFTWEGTARRLDWVRGAAGARFPELELNALVQAVLPAPDARGVADTLVDRLPGLAVEQILTSPYLLLGSVEQMVDALRRRRQRLGISYYVVFETALEALAPVVAELSGQ